VTGRAAVNRGAGARSLAPQERERAVRGRPPRGQRIRPRWGRILLVLCTVVGVLVGAAAFGAWGYVNALNDDLNRTDPFSGLTGGRPPENVEGSLNILILGTDSRDPEANHDGASEWRTDTIILLHVPSTHDKAYLISLPRDLWVEIPGSVDGERDSTMAKINAAYAWGGAELMVQTVERFTGVRIDHLVIVDFWGFQAVTDAVGGVTLCVEAPPGEDSFQSIHPPYRTFTAGCHTMSGEVALDYIRQRYQFPEGDFARMRHQQEFLRALLNQATSAGILTSPSRLDDFLRAITDAITVDEEFSLVDMAIQFRNLRSDDLVFLTSPVAGTDTIDGQSVVVSDEERARSLYEAIRRDEMAAWVAQNAPSPSPTPVD